MNSAAKLAGFFSAHAVWSVSDGETLVPIYGYFCAKSGRAMERLDLPRLEESVAFGKERLDENPHGAKHAVLVFDGRLTLERGKIDALIVEFRGYGTRGGGAILAIPYTPKVKRKRFSVHRPKLLELPASFEKKIDALFEAFFEGVAEHEKGAEVWNKHLDESM